MRVFIRNSRWAKCGHPIGFYPFGIPSAVIKKLRFIHRVIVRPGRINDGDTISLDTIPLKA
jgi:hypothetical protein